MKGPAASMLLVLVACAEPRVELKHIGQSPVRVAPITAAPPRATPATQPQARDDLASEAELVLPIAARDQAPDAPPSGWCGETAIQEGLLHMGVWAPQSFINRAGRPSHPDLYSHEIPVALAALGVRFSAYRASKPGFASFAAWSRHALEEGDPVIAGVKILPTAHPDWELDHFVLVVGHGQRGLLVNTTWGRREWVAEAREGLSLHNAVYGIRLRSIELPPRANRARLEVLEERGGTVRLRASCSREALEVVVDANEPARFHCTPHGTVAGSVNQNVEPRPG
jgi:hypothetical protein